MSNKEIYITKSETETKNLGRNFARLVLKRGEQKRAIIIGLKGDLGGGKTTFLQGFVKGLGIQEKVQSPTFVIMKKFSIPHSYFKYFYHFDCYRIKGPGELMSLGFNQIAREPHNIIALEWAEKAEFLLSSPFFEIKFKFLDRKKRKIMIKYKK